MSNPNDLLNGSPYLVPEDDRSLGAFTKTAEMSLAVANRARRAWLNIASETTSLLEPFLLAQRSELVSQSNLIEGYQVSPRQVQDAVSTYQELLDGPVHALLEVLRADEKIVTTLGLFKAQQIADEWAHRRDRPQAYELRQLHALITADTRFGGQYRTHDVAIGGTHFRPPAHYDVSKCMDQYAQWWLATTSDPILDAAVAHAWLTHIHPYEDGYGRLARVLANLVLSAAEYPPLIIRSDSDRGQYYAALAESDEGNILPLYELFAQIIGRTTRVMSRPNYVRDVLGDRLLSTESQQRDLWTHLLSLLRQGIRRQLKSAGWSGEYQGTPDLASFAALSERDKSGNGWLELIADGAGAWRWLVWCGFNSSEILDLVGKSRTGYPSVLVSRRDTSPVAPHPFVWEKGLAGLPDELLLTPLDAKPVLWRSGFNTESLSIDETAERLVRGMRTFSSP